MQKLQIDHSVSSNPDNSHFLELLSNKGTLNIRTLKHLPVTTTKFDLMMILRMTIQNAVIHWSNLRYFDLVLYKPLKNTNVYYVMVLDEESRGSRTTSPSCSSCWSVESILLVDALSIRGISSAFPVTDFNPSGSTTGVPSSS